MAHEKRRVELLAFDDFLSSSKVATMQAKIKEVESEGFSFIEAVPVAFTESIKYVGGALELHFKKNDGAEEDRGGAESNSK